MELTRDRKLSGRPERGEIPVDLQVRVQILRLAPLAQDDNWIAPLAQDDNWIAPLAQDDNWIAPLAQDDRAAVIPSEVEGSAPGGADQLQVFLDETRAEMHVDLDERRVADATEAVDFACLDDEHIPCTALELHTVHVPEPAPFPDELDFVVWMTMWSGTLARLRVQKENGDVDVPVLGADELVGAANERKVLLSDVVHAAEAPMKVTPGTRRVYARRARNRMPRPMARRLAIATVANSERDGPSIL
ncbi:MAG: hypothetical protein ABI625_18920 [bacterium]